MSLPANWVTVTAEDGGEYYWNKVTNETTWERPAAPAMPGKPAKPPKPIKPPRPQSEMPRTEAKVAVGAARPYSEVPRYGAESKTSESGQKLSTSPITTSFRAALASTPRTSSASSAGTSTPQRRPSWGSKGEAPPDDRMRRRTYTSAAEAADRMTQLQILFEGAMVMTGKRLLREGPLQKHNRDGIKPYQFFLFEDLLVYAKPNVLNDNYTLNREIPLVSCMTGPKETGKPAHSFVLLSRQKSFHVQGDTAEESNSWKEAIEQTARAAQRTAGLVLTAADCAPLWESNENAQECQLCARPFNLVNRRHHCRNCGKCVCQSCAIDKVRIARIDPKALFKVCNPCSREIKSQRKYGVQALQS